MKTRLAILSICLAAFCLKSTELWRFLPNFQVDVRGIQHAIQHGPDIVETLPVPAETLLSANSPLTESQRNELHWHPARFPHRDFVSMMPQRNVFGWYGCLFDIPQALQDMMSWQTWVSSTTRTRPTSTASASAERARLESPTGLHGRRIASTASPLRA